MEFVDINIAADGNAIATNDKIALIDADTIAYTACTHVEKVIELLPREFYSDEEWARLTANGEPDIDGRIYESNFDEIIAYAQFKINKILTLTGCKSCELHFTEGKSSFRYDIYPDYKANRKPIHRPMYLTEVKAKLCQLREGYIHTDIEADDAVVFIARQEPSKYILCAVDKDVLNSVEGRHFNYYESGHYNIDMKWQETDAETARLFPYRQAIMGDRSDNIIGLDRIGPKRVLDIIPYGIKDPLGALISEFEKQGRTAEEAKLNFALCYMGDKDRCKHLTFRYNLFKLAETSVATKLKVAAMLVNEKGEVISSAVNKVLDGLPIPCEDEHNKTYDYVSHAEEGAIFGALRQGISTYNTKMYITHSPCCNCIKLIAQAGIKEVHYYKQYKDIPEWVNQISIKFIKEN